MGKSNLVRFDWAAKRLLRNRKNTSVTWKHYVISVVLFKQDGLREKLKG